MAKALRLAWISQFLSNDEKWNEVWKAIANHFFALYVALFFLRCNYNTCILSRLVGGAVASWLVRLSPERVVRVRTLAGDIVLCS